MCPGAFKTVSFEKLYLERSACDLPAARVPANLSEKDLAIRAVVEPSYEHYRELIDAVGKDLGWSTRSYVNNRAAVEELIFNPLNELVEFFVREKRVGFALVEIEPKKRSAEVGVFAFLPTDTGCGFGSYFFPQLLHRTVERVPEVTRFWLSTRSTNDKRVLPFYEGFGFREYKRVACGPENH